VDLRIAHNDLIRMAKGARALVCILLVLFVFCEDDMRRDVETVNDLEGDRYAGYPVPGGYSIIAVEDRAFTAIELSWEQATDSGTPQEQLEYRVYFSPVNNLRTVGEIDAHAGSITRAMDWTPAARSLQVTDLDPGTRYYFNVLVRDASGNRSSYMATRGTTLTANLLFLFSTDQVAGRLESELIPGRGQTGVRAYRPRARRASRQGRRPVRADQIGGLQRPSLRRRACRYQHRRRR
jgi:hypothetical protein